MANPYEIQVALADAIRVVTMNAVVIPRNILGEIANGNYAMLQSGADGNRIHGWFVSEDGDPLDKAFQGYSQYDVRFMVWQIYEYRTGNDASNSEMEFSNERWAVCKALSLVLPPPLDTIQPPDFPPGNTGVFSKIGENRKPVHIARGTVTAKGINTAVQPC